MFSHRANAKLLLILAMLATLLLAACSPASEASDSAAEAETAQEATDEPAEEPTEEAVEEEVAEEEATEEPVVEEETDVEEVVSAEIVTITHAQGETDVPTNPETVVVLDYSVLDTLDELGVDSVAAIPQGPLVPPHLSQYNGEEYVNAGSLFEPDFEAINALEPDLIIVALRSSTSYEPLAEIAPTIDLTYDPADFINSVSTHAESLGTIFGKQAEVDELLAGIDADIAEVNELASASGETALFILTTGGEVSAYGPGSRFGMVHDLLGVAPAVEDVEAATHGDSISHEFILENNPGILFVMDRDAAIGEESQPAAEILDNELVHATDAWTNDKIIYVNGANWYLANSGLGTLSEMIAEVKSAFE